ncbi:MAG: hypothetical protein ACLVJH_19340 [Faecalibacterium prausnitzii]
MIGTARSERDGTLIFAPAAGTVVAQLGGEPEPEAFRWRGRCRS